MIFFFNDTATTEIYTLSLHDALPIWLERPTSGEIRIGGHPVFSSSPNANVPARSEEHTSELQSRPHLVCRLLLEKQRLRNGRQSPAGSLQLRPGPHRHPDVVPDDRNS